MTLPTAQWSAQARMEAANTPMTQVVGLDTRVHAVVSYVNQLIVAYEALTAANK